MSNILNFTEKLHQRRFSEIVSSCSTYQTSPTRVHNQNPAVDFYTIIQGMNQKNIWIGKNNFEIV